MLKVFGIIGFVFGLAIIIMTAVGAVFHTEPARGYLVGGVFAVAGIFRFLRGMNR
jgi:hypothetical protein